MNKNRKICLTGLALCLLAGGYLRLCGFDWGYDRLPDSPPDAQGGYIHPDERGVYSKAAGLRWDPVPRETGESFLDYQVRAFKRRFLDRDSGLNIDSFNYGSFPYYLLILLSWLGNTFTATEARIFLLKWMLVLFLARWAFLLGRGQWGRGPHPTFKRLLIELAAAGFLYGLLAWGAHFFFKVDGLVWGYGTWGLLGRPISALFGTLTILYTYRIGARVYSRRAGLMAAIFLTFTVLHIQLCHFYTFDVIQAFFSTAAVYSLLVLLDAEKWCRRWRAGVAASIMAGLGLATKFGVILFFIPWGAAILMIFYVHRPQIALLKTRTILFALHLQILGLATFLVFWLAAFAGQPFAFLNYLEGPQKPALSFVHLDLSDRPGQPHSPIRSFLQDVGDRINPITSPLGFHFGPLFHPDTRRPFEQRLTIGSSRHWKDVYEQQQMAVSGGGVPWTRQYNHTTPFIYQWKNLLYYGMGIPLGLLCLIGLAWGFGKPFYRPDWKEWIHWLWMAPNFITTMMFHTKFPRYLTPQIPFFCLWAAAVAIWAYAWLRHRRYQQPERSGRWHLVPATLAIVAVVWSALYSFAFVEIYREDHTWTVCSKWFETNVPEGKRIVTEQWDDSVPWDGRVSSRYGTRTTQPVHSDDPSNIRQIAEAMSWTDYYCFSSKRNYGAFLQSPETAPNRIRMVKSLFAGNLGLKLVKTFSRPVSVLGIPIRYELADESLSLYDHPTVHIFQRTEDIDDKEIVERINNPPAWIDSLDKTQILAADEHRSILAPPATYATPAWLAGLFILGWLVWPVTFGLFRGLADGGIFAARMLAMVLLTYGAWFGASVGWWPNEAWATTFVLGILAALSFICYRINRHHIHRFLRTHGGLILFSEILFLLVFAFFFGIRTSNPDINWGEKAMDASFVNAAYKNLSFPAADPWYAGRPANYYYYGHLIVGLFGRWVGAPPEYAYNLAAGTWPSLVFMLIFGIVFNLSGSRLGGLIAGFLATMAGSVKAFIQIAANLHVPGGPADPKEFRENYIPHDGLVGYLNDAWVQIKAALGLFPEVWSKVWLAFRAALSPTEYLTPAQDQHLSSLLGFDSYFWKLSRIIKSSVACEFPAWSATFADLHAHLLVMPIGMLTLSLSIAYCLRKAEVWRLRTEGRMTDALDLEGGPWTTFSQLLVIGLLLGVVSITNTWDYPGLIGFFSVSCLLLFITHRRTFFPATAWTVGRSIVRMGIWGDRFRKLGWWKMGLLQEVLLPAAAVFLFSRVFFYPFHQSFTTPERVKGIGWMHQAGSGWTTPDELIQIFGVFMLFLMVGLILHYWRWITSTRGAGFKALCWWVLSAFAATLGTVFLRELARKAFDPSTLSRAPSKQDEIIYWKYLDADIAYLVGGFIFFLLLLWLPFIFRRGTSLKERMAAMVLSLGLAIIAGCEVVYIIEGWSPPTHRWNTIFKFHLQAWLCLSIGVGCIAGAWWNYRRPLLPFALRLLGRFGRYVIAYPLMIFALMVAAVFPLAAPYIFSYGDGFEGRTRQITGVQTADGLNFLRIKEPDVAAGIDWLRSNVIGTPVVVEAAGESYQDHRSRFSTHTGLPTLIGWVHHSRERGNSPEPRIEDCRLLYTSVNREKVRDLLQREKVRYVIVGPTERSLYSAAGGKGIDKFDEWPDLFRPVFQSEIKPPGVAIYQVDPAYRLQSAAVKSATKEEGFFVRDEGLALLRGAEGFGAGQYREPRAVIVSKNGSIYVADTQNHRVQNFNGQTAFQWSLGEQGVEPGYFKEPNDLELDEETGQLYVLDTWNARVQVFSPTGEIARIFTVSAFGPRGIAVGRIPFAVEHDGLFKIPEGAAVSDKLVFIADTGEKSVEAYTPDGKKAFECGNSGEENTRLAEPVDVEITPLGLAVTDARNTRVVFYDGRGKFLEEWKIPTESTGGTTNEMHLAWDDAGQRLLVSDPEHNQIFVFNNQGQVVSQTPVPGSPVGLALASDGRVYVTLRGKHRINLISLK